MADDSDGARRAKLVEKALRALGEADAELDSLVAIQRQLTADSRRLSKLATQLSHAVANAEADPKERQQLQETNTSVSLQTLQLAQNIDESSRRFTLLSNIMKTRHDTAKNSISNIR